MSKEKFVEYYLDEYVIMAYRKLNNKVDNSSERKLIKILYNLIDKYYDGELNDYVLYNKIV